MLGKNLQDNKSQRRLAEVENKAVVCLFHQFFVVIVKLSSHNQKKDKDPTPE